MKQNYTVRYIINTSGETIPDFYSLFLYKYVWFAKHAI